MSLFSEELLKDMPTLANPSSDEDESDDDDDFIEKFKVKGELHRSFSIIYFVCLSENLFQINKLL